MKSILRLIIFFLLLCSSSVVISLWSGLLWRNSVVILLFSLAVSYFLLRKFPFEEHVPRAVYLVSLLAFLMAVYPLLTIHPFYDASADGAPAVATAVIGDRIPETYAPYSNLEYRYQIGLPLLARIVADFLPSVPAYLIVWLLSAIFLALQPLFLYLLAKKYFNSEKAGIWSAILFLGSKVAFQSIYSGEYGFLSASLFFFAAATFFLHRNKLACLFIPAVFIIHPGPALNMVFFFAAFFLFFRKELNILPAVLSPLAALPSFFISYRHMIYNTLFSSIGSAPSVSGMLRLLPVFPVWLGIVPFTAAAAGIITSAARGLSDRKHLVLVSLLLTSLALNVTLVSAGSLIGAKIVGLGVFSAVLLGGSFLSGLGLSRRHFKPAAVALTALCLFFFLTSSTLTHYRSGSKITPEEASFASMFRDFDPSLKKTLFLSNGSGKMAQISGKIPFDISHSWFLPYNEVLIANDPARDLFRAKQDKRTEILETGCITCIHDLNIDYVVINRAFFARSLPQKPVLSWRSFDLYALD
jgi:hypothetical protein